MVVSLRPFLIRCICFICPQIQEPAVEEPLNTLSVHAKEAVETQTLGPARYIAQLSMFRFYYGHEDDDDRPLLVHACCSSSALLPLLS